MANKPQPKLDGFGTVRIHRMGDLRKFRIKINVDRAKNVNSRGKHWREDANWFLKRVREHIKRNGLENLAFVDLDRDPMKVVDIVDLNEEAERRERP